MRRWKVAADRLARATLAATLLLFCFSTDPVQADTQATVTATLRVTTGSLEIVASGASLTLASWTLDGTDHAVKALSTPTLVCKDATGLSQGWNVTLRCSDFKDSQGIIPAANFTFIPMNTAVICSSGQPVDPANGPREPTSGGSLANSLRIVTCAAGYGKGVYSYQPDVNSFSLLIPATLSVGDGNFSATITATISVGP